MRATWAIAGTLTFGHGNSRQAVDDDQVERQRPHRLHAGSGQGDRSDGPRHGRVGARGAQRGRDLHGRGEAPVEAHRGADRRGEGLGGSRDDGGTRRRRHAGARGAGAQGPRRTPSAPRPRRRCRSSRSTSTSSRSGSRRSTRVSRTYGYGRARCARRRARRSAAAARCRRRRRRSTTSSVCRARSTRSRPRRAWATSCRGGRASSIDAERKLKEMSEKSSMDDALAELKKKLNNP